MRDYFRRFVHSEVTSSIVLLICTVTALVWANSPWAGSYQHMLHIKAGISWGGWSFSLSLHHWVNDGLMVVFFFVVGLEIKRELLVGRLSSLDRAILPVTAALGGMIVPALLYYGINHGGPAAGGWGIPMATDIAFAIGLLAVFGKRVPIGLKVFLMALAIADDLGAVLVIALFYTEKINLTALMAAAVLLVVLAGMIKARVNRVGPLAAVIVAFWAAVLVSGVHATIAGILVALLVPVKASMEPDTFIDALRTSLDELTAHGDLTRASMIEKRSQLGAIDRVWNAGARMYPSGLALEQYLHPVQAFFVLPLFALFNAGVVLRGDPVRVLMSAEALGVIVGLVLGKQLGVVGFTWIAVKSGRAHLPEGVTFGQVWGVAALAGIGFTMSLFVSDLAFEAPGLLAGAKLGILVASLLSGIFGAILLFRVLPRAESG
ncbi:MAG: Na+/H+ antiporter NhaA [Acidobacteria bacterium]|nr:Na+/H+ antiporter NhaA [Acidobacteriota bacterium]